MNKYIISLILLCSFAPVPAGAADATLQDNAPDRYIVVPGDTLWGIAGRFLKDPWRWPELMRLNKDQIKNPNRIYPGDVLVLDRSAERARLRVLHERTVQLSPQIRTEPLAVAAIPTIQPADIEPFLSQPRVVGLSDLQAAPRIVATQENRVVIGAGNIAYAKGLPKGGSEVWQIFRPGNPLIDPDSNEQLGYEAIYLGDAKLVRPGDVSTLEIIRSEQEIYVGDRMYPPPGATFTSYVPHAPDKPVKGRIISAYGSLAEVGASAIVTLNRGSRDGLEIGHVLAIYRSSSATRDVYRNSPMYSGRTGLFRSESKQATTSEPMSGFRNTPMYGRQGPTGRDDDSIKTVEAAPEIPDERYGLLFVFRVFDRVSYALVMRASRPVSVLDVVQNP